MNVQRINTVVLHTWFHLTHTLETWVDLVWNAGLQMLLFAFLASAFGDKTDPTTAWSMLAGMIFWNFIWVAQYSLTIGVLWEIWSKSLTSLFITPLTLEEFFVGQMVSSVLKAFISVAITAAIGFVVYGFSIFIFGWYLPLYALMLLIVGWAFGMLMMSLIFRYGTDVQSLSWSLVFLIQPFGGVFYPATILPPVIRFIPYSFPTSYIFDSMRIQMQGGTPDPLTLGKGFMLSLIYLGIGYCLLKYSFAKAKASGSLARMES
jgi:ABC-2 type transport system permease protein